MVLSYDWYLSTVTGRVHGMHAGRCYMIERRPDSLSRAVFVDQRRGIEGVITERATLREAMKLCEDNAYEIDPYSKAKIATTTR